jgi:hypothetical protein
MKTMFVVPALARPLKAVLQTSEARLALFSSKSSSSSPPGCTRRHKRKTPLVGTVEKILPIHLAQLLTYLKLSALSLGSLSTGT